MLLAANASALLLLGVTVALCIHPENQGKCFHSPAALTLTLLGKPSVFTVYPGERLAGAGIYQQHNTHLPHIAVHVISLYMFVCVTTR